MSNDVTREICVHVAGGEAAAQQVKSFLLSRGIPCRFRGESLRKVHGFTLNGLGEVRIYVPGEFEREARDLLERVEAGAMELSEDEPIEAQTKRTPPLSIVPPEGDDGPD